MADHSVGARTRTTWMLMGAATVAVIVFLWWLSATSEPSSVAIVEPNGAGGNGLDEPGAEPATTVDVSDFALGPDGFVGQRIRIERLEVASRLGERAFWAQLPSQVPYLVRVDSTAAPQGGIRSGTTVGAVGTIYMMSDSVLDAWEQTGVITEAQRPEASFATSFLEATRVRTAAARDEPTGATPPTQNER